MADVTGIERVLAALQKLGAVGPQALGAALFQEGEAIMATSKETYCPVDTGILQASGYVEPPVIEGALTTVTLGYGGAAQAYALAVHENPRSGHTEGFSPSGKKYAHWAKVGSWKFLETPAKLAVEGLTDRLAAHLEQVIDENT